MSLFRRIAKGLQAATGNAPMELPTTLPELQARKTQLALAKREVMEQMRTIRARHTEAMRRDYPPTEAQARRDPDRYNPNDTKEARQRQLASDLASHERKRERIEREALAVDQAIASFGKT